MCDACDDSRFEIIEQYKQKLIDSTNIESRPEEMAVIDSVLFRMWQMGWIGEVEPVKHGKWVWNRHGMDWNIGAWCCSCCGVMSPMWWNTTSQTPEYESGHSYCPNCGAKMDQED